MSNIISVACPPQIRAVNQWIDYQRQAAVVGSGLKAKCSVGAFARYYKTALHLLLFAPRFLIGKELSVRHCANGCLDLQVPVVVYQPVGGAFDANGDLFCAGAGMYDKVVARRTIVVVHHCVDAGVQSIEPYAAIKRYFRGPFCRVVAYKIVVICRLQAIALRCSGGGVEECHAEDMPLALHTLCWLRVEIINAYGLPGHVAQLIDIIYKSVGQYPHIHATALRKVQNRIGPLASVFDETSSANHRSTRR